MYVLRRIAFANQGSYEPVCRCRNVVAALYNDGSDWRCSVCLVVHLGQSSRLIVDGCNVDHGLKAQFVVEVSPSVHNVI